ncbi:unnamed protein product [Cuscuta europaea]|uniref:Uncharacterized protein n=1 Tax=Cuscuta europaea TaxID=41803 RepID=A0A9P1EKM2_CUSEU|nr:unnamed protein product [Cuscuta europaea]
MTCFQTGLYILQSETARDRDALEAKHQADEALRVAQDAARQEREVAARRGAELQAALDTTFGKLSVAERHDFAFTPVPLPPRRGPVRTWFPWCGSWSSPAMSSRQDSWSQLGATHGALSGIVLKKSYNSRRGKLVSTMGWSF